MYFMKPSIFQNTTKKFDRFLPGKIIQTRYVGLSKYVLYIITQSNIFKHLVYKTFLGRNLSNFSVVFWKMDGFIKYILTLSDLQYFQNSYLLYPFVEQGGLGLSSRRLYRKCLESGFCTSNLAMSSRICLSLFSACTVFTAKLLASRSCRRVSA